MPSKSETLRRIDRLNNTREAINDILIKIIREHRGDYSFIPSKKPLLQAPGATFEYALYSLNFLPRNFFSLLADPQLAQGSNIAKIHRPESWQDHITNFALSFGQGDITIYQSQDTGVIVVDMAIATIPLGLGRLLTLNAMLEKLTIQEQAGSLRIILPSYED